MRVDGFAVLPAFTFGLAISTYIGQNIGARKQERLKPGERSALVLALGISSLIVSALFIFGKCFIGFFINKDTTDAHIYQSVVALGGRGLRILAVGYIALGIQQIYAGILRAAGDTMSSMIISIITTVVVRVPLAYTIAFFTRSEQWQNGHPDALFLSLVTSWTLNATLTFLRYKQGKWKKIDLIGKKGKC